MFKPGEFVSEMGMVGGGGNAHREVQNWAGRPHEVQIGNKRAANIPQTSHVPQRGRTVGGTAGNSLMSNGLNITSQSPFHQRPKNDLKSILTGAGPSFNPERSISTSQDFKLQKAVKQPSTALSNTDKTSFNQAAAAKRRQQARH
jgi:hypothetical protein